MMKLDLNSTIASEPLEKSTKPSTSVSATAISSTSSTTTSEDRTTFRSGDSTVKSLVSQAIATPDVRQAKVDALKQSISSGDYKFDAGKVADAMIADSKES